MKRIVSIGMVLAVISLLGGCASGEGTIAEGFRSSPTGQLLRGDIPADQYFREVARANEETRQREQFEINRDPTRAYNTQTGKVEFVPQDTQQYWNSRTRRWEFTPREPVADTGPES